MSRWDYDTVFYRVFCITLLAVAFTFTVILTNVFVDIDGLLYTKDKVKTTTASAPKYERSNIFDDVIEAKTSPNDNSEDTYDDKDYQDSNDLYRSKRSLVSSETPEQLFHIKDPKVKKLLTDRLADLLDEIDEEKHITDVKDLQVIDVKDNKRHESKDKENELKLLQENSVKHKESQTANEAQSVIENIKENKEISDKLDENDKILHFAMHSIILRGIIERMNLDDIYKNVADLVKKFESNHSKSNKDEFKTLLEQTYFKKPHIVMKEDIPVDEILNLKNTEKQTDSKNNKIFMKLESDNNIEQNVKNMKPKDPNVIIKTIIDITAMSNDKTNKGNINSKINGIIKLIYNGKTIRFKNVSDENNTNRFSLNNSDFKDTESVDYKYNDQNVKNNDDDTKNYKLNRNYLKRLIHDYFRRFHEVSDSSKKVYSRKRLKRHIKIRYDIDKQDATTTTTEKPKVKKDDDELFVEIETHFDSKGAKGEKKKKLIKSLIEKIENAIHSETEGKKKKPKHWHVKKRIQNPLVSKTATAIINKLMIPLETLAHRHLDPISKVVPSHEQISSMSDVFGRSHWHQNYQRPKFFNKGINSAEMNTVDTDYNKVMSHNGIPQRLQKPLNTEISDEALQDSNIFDLGNIKFLMKDIEGTGFSIGFNQYTDEAPDSETMKLFSGLQNIIQTYHQTYDQDDRPNEPVAYTQQQDINDNAQKNDEPGEVNENQEQIDKSNQHLIQRRSIEKYKHSDHHINNNYRVLYDHNVLPYNNYQEIYNKYQSDTGVKRIKLNKWKEQNAEKAALFLDENVFEKDLKPAEILSIADLFQRRKRSMNIKKISNVKIKQNTNRRYLNTQSMASKNILMQKKRNKREIDKIRIIARDNSMPHTHQNSEEDIFVVSGEKIFADRVLVKEMEVADLTYDDKTPLVENYDIIPQKEEEPYDIINQPHKENEDHYDIVSPFTYDASPFETQISEFGRRARHNSLMSKYPHIITDETHRSFDPSEDVLSDTIQNGYYTDPTTETIPPSIIDAPVAHNNDIAELITPPKDNTNYKVSVKIRPKNATGMSGFKEVHTSINKSYHKNGLMYTSLVNVSQVSKVEKINKTTEKNRRDFDVHTSKVNLKQQHELIKSLIRQHKHRLDHQLKQLQIEKEKLENINADSTDTLADKLIEIKNSLNTNKLVHLSQEEVKKLLQLDPTTASVIVTQTTSTTSTTPVTTSTEYIQPITEDPIKIKMINSFERNENITNELLKKIDQNTDVLKTFLGKLIANMEPTRKASAENKNEELNTKNEEKPPLINSESKATQLINNQAQLRFEDYHQQIPQIFFRNAQPQVNHSMGIPFVYAYQQPYSMVSNKDTPMASVVYHGHIHANSLHDNIKRDKTPDNQPELRLNEQDRANEKKDEKERQIDVDGEFWKPKRGEKVLHDFVMKNSSKFFLGDASNDLQRIKMVYTPVVNSTKT